MMKQLSFAFILIFWLCICFAVVGVARAEFGTAGVVTICAKVK